MENEANKRHLIKGRRQLALQKEPLYQRTHKINPTVAVVIMLAGEECSGVVVAGAASDKNT